MQTVFIPWPVKIKKNEFVSNTGLGIEVLYV